MSERDWDPEWDRDAAAEAVLANPEVIDAIRRLELRINATDEGAWGGHYRDRRAIERVVGAAVIACHAQAREAHKVRREASVRFGRLVERIKQAGAAPQPSIVINVGIGTDEDGEP